MKKTNILLAATMILFCNAFAQNVGIGTASPTLAKLQINGSVGASVAMFGADKNGVTISADNPEIGFNYYFNAGSKTIKAGFASLIGMVPASGDFYLGNFNSNQSAADNGTIAGYQNRMVVKQNGRVGFGIDNPTRAALEQSGSVVNTAALFGGDGKGVSLQKDWPAIGLNHYYDGQHKSIGGGYGAQIGVDQNTGAIYIAQFSNNAPVPNGLYLNATSNYFFRNGRLGIGIDAPQAPIHIRGKTSDVNPSEFGIRIERETPLASWNIDGDFNLNFIRNNQFISYIGSNGSYFTSSDQRLKKEIKSFDNEICAKLSRLNSVSYIKQVGTIGSSKREFGFLAQEMEAVFPELVGEMPNGFKAIDYSGLVPVLTKAIQEQQKAIDELKKEVMQLKANSSQ